MKNRPYRSDVFDAIHSSADSLLGIRAIDEAEKADLLPIPTPGQILLEEFLKPSGQSQNALARAIGVSPRRINEIVLGKRAITADTDLRLARYYKISEGIFLGLQADYELRVERRKLGDRLDFIVPRAA
jgi:antitoxin HigA-1